MLRTSLLAIVVATTMAPEMTSAAEPASPICVAAASRMVQAMADASPEFRDALAQKPDVARAAFERVMKDTSRNEAGCVYLLMMPETSFQALAKQPIQ